MLTGAKASVGLFSVDEFMAQISDWQVTQSVKVLSTMN